MSLVTGYQVIMMIATVIISVIFLGSSVNSESPIIISIYLLLIDLLNITYFIFDFVRQWLLRVTQSML